MSSDVVAPRSAYRWLILGGVWLVYFCFGMTTASMAPLVAPITRALALSNAAMGSVLGAWPLVYIAAAIPCGAVLDRIGARWALLVAALIMMLSATFRSLADGYLELFLAVALFGLGGPLVSIGAPKLIALWFTGKERGLAMGVYITGPALGAMVALSATNSLLMPALDHDWRQVLRAYGALMLLAGLIWFCIASHPINRALEQRLRGTAGRSWRVFADLIELPAVRLVLMISVGVFFYNHGLNNWLPEILRSGGMDPARAGFWASMPTAVSVLAALTIPRLAVPQRRLWILVALFAGAAAATLLLHSGREPLLAAALVLQGLARGAMMAISVMILLERPEVGARNAGAAGGLFFSAAEVGGVLGPLAIGVVSGLSGGFASSLYMLSGVMLILILLAMRLRRSLTPP